MSDMITLLGEYAEELARQDKEIASLTAEARVRQTIVEEARDERDAALAENEKLRAALRECEAKLNAYYRMEYPSNLPYSQKKLAQAMASNPATVALKENNDD
jgi:hypothetical protein